MTIDVIDSRVGPTGTGGTLTIGGKSWETQTTSAALTPSVSTSNDGDAVPLLSGITLEGSESDETTWTLDVGIISDFTNPTGLVEFCRANAGQVKPYVWTPNDSAGPTYSGEIRVRALPIGGEVRSRLTPSVSFPVIGAVDEPTWNPAAP